ncbi:MAG: Flp pilus assembly complex ATPase component TadA [Bdellovibrionales bacterium]|nr:Flp pilus assembly complex ATPase component TadA [Bdellovibrionales bacterium]
MNDKNRNLPAAVPYLPVKTGGDPREIARCSSYEARKKLSYFDALKWQVLPMSIMEIRGERLLTLLTTETVEVEVVKAIRFLTDCSLKMVTAESEIVREAIFIAYRGDEVDFCHQVAEVGEQLSLRVGIAEIEECGIADNTVPGVLKRIIALAVARGASDLTILPTGGGSFRATIRIDGILSPLSLDGYSSVLHLHLLNRVRVIAKLPMGASGQPQDGAFQMGIHQGALTEVRFHIFPTVFGDKINFRLPIKSDVPRLEALGLSRKTTDFSKVLLERAQGAIIVAGATGSGKTTTLYSMVNELIEKNLSIVSLEDPVERVVPQISQTDLSRSKGISYASGLKSVLRQDPDVILIGEIRDGESARMALEAATTGHLVLSTVHALDVSSVIERLIRFVNDRVLVAHALSLIVTQKLVPRLCSRCKVIHLKGSRSLSASVYQAVGCPACDHSGYRGRLLLDESLYCTRSVRDRIISELFHPQELPGNGYYHCMAESVHRGIIEGQIDIATGRRAVTFDSSDIA